MKYPYTNKAQSFVNRVVCATFDEAVADYGNRYNNLLVSILWNVADHNCDYGSEMDDLLDGYDYNLADEWLNGSVWKGHGAPAETLEEAMWLILDVEFHITLAQRCVQAMLALDAGARDLNFSVYEEDAAKRITEEFRTDRQQANHIFKEKLAQDGHAAFEHFLHEHIG